MLVRVLSFFLLLTLLIGCQAEAENFRDRKYLLDQTIYSRVDRFMLQSQSGEYDSLVVDDTQYFSFGENRRISCDIFAKDVVLGKNDSVRIGIVHPLEKVYAYPVPAELPDHIVLSVYGQDTIPFELEQQNVGPVTNRTYFRINRNFYALTALDSSRQNIEITTLDRRPSSPTVAELITRFKQAPVRTLAGQDTLIRHQYGQKAILYFFAVGSFEAKEKITSVIRQLDSAAYDDVQILLINRNDTPENIEEFLADSEIKEPVFLSTGATCSGLQCVPRLPYAVVVNESGRIVSHYVKPEHLLEYLDK